MAEIHISQGPIEAEPLDAIKADMGEGYAARTRALANALDTIALGSYDREIADWLARRESSTVATVCSWLHRVRAAGPAIEAQPWTVLRSARELVEATDWDPRHDAWNVTSAIWAASGRLAAGPAVSSLAETSLRGLADFLGFVTADRHAEALVRWSQSRTGADVQLALATAADSLEAGR